MTKDAIRKCKCFFFEYICTVLKDTGKLLCENTDFLFECKGNKDSVLYSDYELILQVFENLISNAIRVRRKTVDCQIILSDEYLLCWLILLL